MQLLKFELGDEAWIFVGNHKGKKSKGTVVHKFKLEGWWCEHYVIEIPTHIDPLLEVRDGLAMSDAADKPIGLWRKDVTKS